MSDSHSDEDSTEERTGSEYREQVARKSIIDKQGQADSGKKQRLKSHSRTEGKQEKELCVMKNDIKQLQSDVQEIKLNITNLNIASESRPMTTERSLSAPEGDFEKHSTRRATRRCGVDVAVQTEEWIDIDDDTSIWPSSRNIAVQTRTKREVIENVRSTIFKTVPSAKHVWGGYRPGKRKELLFVADVEESEKKDLPMKLDSFEITYRCKKDISPEGELVERGSLAMSNHFNDSEFDRLNICIAKHAKDLMEAHSNLEIISGSCVKSTNFGTKAACLEHRPCIVLYVKVKGIIPFSEEPFPSSIEEFTVDVREGSFVPQSDPEATKYFKNLVMGCKVESFSDTAGTLGGFVRLADGSIGFLTCCHVVLDENSIGTLKQDSFAFHQRMHQFKIDVFQPSNDEGQNHLGFVQRVVHRAGSDDQVGIDAALVVISDKDRHPIAGVFPKATSDEAGYSDEAPMVFDSGDILTSISTRFRRCSVLKYGMASGHTVGILRLKSTAVRRTYFTHVGQQAKYELFQQMEIISGHAQKVFSDFGDSGSLVFMTINGRDDDVKAIGLLVGGTTYNTTIVTPIWEVLKALDLPLKLFSFRSPADTEHVSEERTLENKVSDIDKKLDAKVADLNNQMSTLRSDMSKIEHKVDEGFAAVLSKLQNLK